MLDELDLIYAHISFFEKFLKVRLNVVLGLLALLVLEFGAKL